MKRSMESVPSAKAFRVLEMSGCYLFSLRARNVDPTRHQLLQWFGPDMSLDSVDLFRFQTFEINHATAMKLRKLVAI